jgi:hypothetical protein
MIESPVYQEIVEEAERKGATEARRKDLLKVLLNRFGGPAKELEVELEAVDYERLDDLFEQALGCQDLPSFRKRLLS